MDSSNNFTVPESDRDCPAQPGLPPDSFQLQNIQKTLLLLSRIPFRYSVHQHRGLVSSAISIPANSKTMVSEN